MLSPKSNVFTLSEKVFFFFGFGKRYAGFKPNAVQISSIYAHFSSFTLEKRVSNHGFVDSMSFMNLTLDDNITRGHFEKSLTNVLRYSHDGLFITLPQFAQPNLFVASPALLLCIRISEVPSFRVEQNLLI